MEIFKIFLKRLLITGLPLLGLYLFAQIAFENNSKSEHPKDVGLGIALLLFVILFILSVGLIIDFVIRIKRKQYKIAVTNVPFLLLFLFPILYIKCQMSGYCEDCFCSWLIETVKHF
ncbi:MAG: hypothetical protein ACOVNP_04200 [Flavobacterium sp.]